MVFVFGMPFESHQVFVIQHQIGAFVVAGENREGVVKFGCQPASFGISFCRLFAQFDEPEDFFGQRVSHPGNRAGCPAADKAVKHLRVDTDHQRQIGIGSGDVLGCVAERFRPAEFLEADQIRVLLP